METTMLILTIIGTVATVVSTIIAIRAKNEAKEILNEIKTEKNRNVMNSGEVKITTKDNSGVITGINMGEVYQNAKTK